MICLLFSAKIIEERGKKKDVVGRGWSIEYRE